MVQLTPPRLITFVVSVILLGAVVASFYLRVPFVGHFVGAHRTGLLIAAYAVLAAGVVSRAL